MAEISRTLSNLSPATRYVVRVRALNEFGVPSAWSEALDFTTMTDNSIPQAPENLVLEFESPSLVASWSENLTNTDGSPFLDFKAYQISFTAGGLTKSYLTTIPNFVYPFAQNRADFEAAQPHLDVTVRALDISGHDSLPLSGAATNSVPPDPPAAPVATPGFTVINVTMDAGNLRDLDGFDLYHSTNSGGPFTLLASTTNGTSSFDHAVGAGTQHFYKYKIRDVFSQLSANFSPIGTVTTFTINTVDTTPPADVIGLAVTANALDSQQRPFVELSWDFNTDPDLASYEIRYRRQSDSVYASVIVGHDVTSRRFTNLISGTLYYFQIRAADFSGNLSNWQPDSPNPNGLAVTTVIDAGAPAAPTGLTLSPGIRTMILQWNPPTTNSDLASPLIDFDHYDIHIGTAPGFTATAQNLYSKLGPGSVESINKYWNGSAFVDLVPGTTYYVRMYAVDATGNKSPATGEVSATTGYLVNSDVQADTITADRITTSTLTAAITVSGSIKTASGGARLELNSSGLVGYAFDGTTKNLEYRNVDNPPGLIVSNTGYLRSSGYISGQTGWYLGAGAGAGLLEINEGTVKAKAIQIGVSGENLLGNASFESYPPSGTDAGLATDWREYPANTRSPLTQTFAKDTGGANFLFQTAAQKMTTVGTPATAGVMRPVLLTDSQIEASPGAPVSVTVSYWVRQAVANTRNARVALKDVTNNLTFTIASAVSLSTTGYTRVVHTATLTANTSSLEIHCWVSNTVGNLTAGEVYYFDGAQLEFSSAVSAFKPNSLKLPDNYIQSAYISSLTADKITSGQIATALIDVAGTGYIQSVNYNTGGGTEAGYRLTASDLTFQNGGINVVGIGKTGGYGGISLDSTSLRAVYSGTTQFKVDSSGVYIGGNSTANADVYFDTANSRTVFQGTATGYTFEINTNPATSNKALRLYQVSNSVDSFYLTYDGLGFFAKGVIGVNSTGSGSNRIKNSSFESRATSSSSAVHSSGTNNLNYWTSFSTGSGSFTAGYPIRVGGGIHGGFACELRWTTNTGNKGLSTSPWVGGANTNVWPANATYTLSVWINQTGTTGLPQIGFNTGGWTVTNVSFPAVQSGAWQRYVWRIVVPGTDQTSDLVIFFTHTNGDVIMDGVQLERGEIATPYAPMPEEVLPVGGSGGTASADELRSSNYVTGVSGWIIQGDGSAEFQDVEVRGTVNATSGTFTNTVTVGSAASSTHTIKSFNYSAGTAGWVIRGDGFAEFRNVTMSNANVTGVITATSGTFTGTVNANAGTFSGTITATGTISGGTIQGALFQTAGSGHRLEADSNNGGQIRFYTGDVNEASYGQIYSNVGGGELEMIISAPTKSGYPALNLEMRTGRDGAGGYFGVGPVTLALIDPYEQFVQSGAFTDWKVYNLPDIGGRNLQRADASSQIGPEPPSSRRFKRDISSLVVDDTSPLWRLRPVRFWWDETKIGGGEAWNEARPGGYANFIAEEVLEVIPEATSMDEEGLPIAVNQTAIVSWLVAGMQHLRQRIAVLEADDPHHHDHTR